MGQPSKVFGTVPGFEAQNAADLPEVAFDAQSRVSLLPNSNQTQVQCYSLPVGTAPRSPSAYAGNMAVAEVAQPSEQSLLSNLHHA